MFSKFKISCEEAATICDKSQYGEATFMEKARLNWHLLICKICSLYTKQNQTMTKLYKMRSSDCKKETNCLSSADKEALKKELEKLKA